jgi:hypothetical protein
VYCVLCNVRCTAHNTHSTQHTQHTVHTAHSTHSTQYTQQSVHTRQSSRENQNPHFMLNKLFSFSKMVPFMTFCGKILQSRTDHRRQYGACALHAGYLRLQTHTRNMYYLLPAHGNKVARTRLNATFTCTLPILCDFSWLHLTTFRSVPQIKPHLVPFKPFSVR